MYTKQLKQVTVHQKTYHKWNTEIKLKIKTIVKNISYNNKTNMTNIEI